ncbi:toprim domain-containing protein [Mucilaginibacter phyllosphaerae]
MSTNSIVKELKESASIIALLDRLGYQPVPKKGREAMYVSMLRDNDNDPSLSVNDRLGVWFDHGVGKGGNIIDFGIAYWKGLKFNQVVAKICETLDMQPPAPRIIRSLPNPRTPNYTIHQVKPLGTHPAINEYLLSRGIFHIAKPYLKEVYYYLEDDKGIRKNYFSAGWQNDYGAWEVRNRLFKGCMGSKAITTIPGHPKNVAVFEGFIDFLSWKKEHPEDLRSIIVLNSVTLWQQGVNKAKAYSSIDLYFDRDPSGKLATRDFLKALPYASDRSSVFDGFKDYNDKIQALQRQQADESKARKDFFNGIIVPFER